MSLFLGGGGSDGSLDRRYNGQTPGSHNALLVFIQLPEWSGWHFFVVSITVIAVVEEYFCCIYARVIVDYLNNTVMDNNKKNVIIAKCLTSNV